jgi:hypothetical protein
MRFPWSGRRKDKSRELQEELDAHFAIDVQDTASFRHVAVINEAFARKYFKNEDPIGKHFARHGIGSEREYEIVGIAKDARYLTFHLERPIPPMFFLPEPQQDLDPKTGLPEIDGSHFLSDIIILTKPGVRLSSAVIRQTIASVDPSLPVIWLHSLQGADIRSVHAAATDCAAQLIFWNSVSRSLMRRALRHHCLQRGTPHR